MFALSVAKRFLWNNKSQTIFIILGIAIGVSVQVFVGSLIQGLQISLIDRTIGSQPHIILESNSTDKRIEAWQDILDDVEDIEGLLYSVKIKDGQLFVDYFTTNRSNELSNITLSSPQVLLARGFDLEEGDKIFKYVDAIYEGGLPSATNEVMIGKETQVLYNLKVGDTLTSSKGRFPFNVTYELKISGFYDLGVASLNRLWAITNFSTVESIFEMGDNITSLVFQVEDVFAADLIADEFSAILTPENGYGNIVIKNWKAENAQLLSGLDGQTISSIMIQAFVIISVVLGITSVLAITVLQKSKQLGILKAMGVNDGRAAQIFVFQGLILGIFGALSGVGLGLGLSYAFTTFAVDSTTSEPIIALFINPNFVILSMIIAIVSCIFAALVPAVRSKRLTVIEVIRNG